MASVVSQYIPYNEFKCLNQNEIDKFDVNSIEENSSDGCILDVDLEYPDELHDFHNVYSLAPEKLQISHMLLNYFSNIAVKYDIKISGVNKLIPNSGGNKSKYVLHYRNLRLYLSLKIKLIKIYRMLKFKQSDWLKKFIGFSTDKMLLLLLKKIFQTDE